MKTITIPTNYDPFRVTVNGKEYVYAGGSTVSVPDDVADVIENIIKPEYEPYDDIETQLSKKLSLSGGTMSGGINMGKNNIIGVGLLRCGASAEAQAINCSNKRILGVGNPSSATDAANKKYVDDSIAAALIVDTDDEVE